MLKVLKLDVYLHKLQGGHRRVPALSSDTANCVAEGGDVRQDLSTGQ